MHDVVIDCPVRLTRTNRDELRALYTDLREHYLRRDARDDTRTTIHFIWHGDDPVTLDPSYFWATFADQRHVFSPSQPIMNSIRTDGQGCADEQLCRHGFNGIVRS